MSPVKVNEPGVIDALKVITIESESLIVEPSAGTTIAVGTVGEGTPHELTVASIIAARNPKHRTLNHLIKTSKSLHNRLSDNNRNVKCRFKLE